MANVPLILPPQLLATLNVTAQEVSQYPEMTKYSDKALYAIADAMRKSLVGVDGTTLKTIEAINNSQDEDMLLSTHVGVFLVKNRLKPMVVDGDLLGAGVMETLRRLARGDMHTVNRRRKYIEEGVVKPAGDDVVPAAVRESWI